MLGGSDKGHYYTIASFSLTKGSFKDLFSARTWTSLVKHCLQVCVSQTAAVVVMTWWRRGQHCHCRVVTGDPWLPLLVSSNTPPHTWLYTGGDITLCWYNDICVPLYLDVSILLPEIVSKLFCWVLHSPFTSAPTICFSSESLLNIDIWSWQSWYRTETAQSQLWSMINITFNCFTILWSSWGLSNISWGFNISKCSIHTRYRWFHVYLSFNWMNVDQSAKWFDVR